MSRFLAVVTVTLCLGLPGLVHAADCEIIVERSACAGKEADSFAKCDGKPSCTTKKSAADEAACRKIAEGECVNKRTDITRSKQVKYSFAGKQSPNVCAADRPDFGKCPPK